MAFRNRLALQTVPQFFKLGTSFTPITGLTLTVRAHSTFFIDLRFYLVQNNILEGVILRIDGWTPQIGNSPNPDGPSQVIWTFYDLNSQTKLEQGNVGTAAENMEWEIPMGAAIRGDAYIFGLIRNDEAFDQVLTVSAATKIGGFQPLLIVGARLIVFEEIPESQIIVFEEIPESQNNNFSDMTNCGCCVTATVSCCQTALRINTINPATDFNWKITDFLGGIFTGTMTTDGTGLGIITVGDGMDLPDGFLDVPGNNFKIEFFDAKPAIASKMECIEVELVGGAYLALTDIGEPLP